MDREMSSSNYAPGSLDGFVGAAVAEETLVADVRAYLTPSQMVERKLEHLLQAVPIPVRPLHRTAFRRPSH